MNVTRYYGRSLSNESPRIICKPQLLQQWLSLPPPSPSHAHKHASTHSHSGAHTCPFPHTDSHTQAKPAKLRLRFPAFICPSKVTFLKKGNAMTFPQCHIHSMCRSNVLLRLCPASALLFGARDVTISFLLGKGDGTINRCWGEGVSSCPFLPKHRTGNPLSACN